MQFLKTVFWVALAVALVVFAANNWTPVSIGLWGGLRMDTKLPVLVIGAFLLGFLPLYLIYRTMLWRMRRRIATLEASNRPAPLDANRTGESDRTGEDAPLAPLQPSTPETARPAGPLSETDRTGPSGTDRPSISGTDRTGLGPVASDESDRRANPEANTL